MGCHQAILSGALDDRYDAEHIARWKRRIVHLLSVPSLKGLERRYTRDWLVRFLQEPQDLRPKLGASMPRFSMPRADAELIADALLWGGPEQGPALEGDPERGRLALLENGCTSCHAFTGALEVKLPEEGLSKAQKMAPDLRFVRQRMTRLSAQSWLASPQALLQDALMPEPGLDEAARRDIVAFLFEARLEPFEPSIPERLPLLERPVRYAEVQREVFKHVCWHCHSDPAPVGGDGGPGNTGGFGYAGKGIDLGSYGALKPELFARDQAGVPRLVAVMLARHAEVAGRPAPGVLGMPLGLPPLSMEKIQLVDSWIAQGHPER